VEPGERLLSVPIRTGCDEPKLFEWQKLDVRKLGILSIGRLLLIGCGR